MTIMPITVTKLIEFGHVMVDNGWFDTPQDVLSYMEKPHNWAPEYQTWAEFGFPQMGDEKWTAFVEAVDLQHEEKDK